ncbi:MAG: hypothetical protein WEA99_06715 [Brumimicrobium sp.]
MNKYSICFSFLILLMNSLLLSQTDSQSDSVESKNIYLSMTFEGGKLDYFHNIQMNTKLFNMLQVESAIGLNITKTYFQSTFSPQLNLGIGYDLLQKHENFMLAPSIKGRTTRYKLNEDVRINYLESLIGYSLLWGDQWFVVHGAYFGRGTEYINSNYFIGLPL